MVYNLYIEAQWVIYYDHDIKIKIDYHINLVINKMT